MGTTRTGLALKRCHQLHANDILFVVKTWFAARITDFLPVWADEGKQNSGCAERAFQPNLEISAWGNLVKVKERSIRS